MKHVYRAVLMAVSVGVPAWTQDTVSAHGLRAMPACSEAAATVRASSEGTDVQRALDRLTGCGEAAFPAVAQGIRNTRRSSDIIQLGRLHRFVQLSPRGGILEAMLSVAQDDSATVEARVSVLAVLTGEFHRNMTVSYDDVAGLNPSGIPAHGCFGDRLAGDYGPSQLTSSDVERIRQVARTLLSAKAQPPDVRSAATCLLP